MGGRKEVEAVGTSAGSDVMTVSGESHYLVVRSTGERCMGARRAGGI